MQPRFGVISEILIPLNIMTKQRNYSLDYMKAILVILMILAHCIQLIFNNSNSPNIISFLLLKISLFVNITTFSSFLFMFGYVFQIAYLSNYETTKVKLLKNAWNTLITYYLCAISITILEKKQFNLTDLLNIIVFNNVIKYSEFLLAFTFIGFISVIFGKQIIYATSTLKKLILSSSVLLFFTFIIPYEKIPIQLGIFIGTTKFSSFPVFLYLPYFLLGVYLSKNNILFNKNILFFVSILSAFFISYIIINHNLPERFPPSFFWISGSFLYSYTLYLFCYFISRRIKHHNRFILAMGSNTLFLLLFSNIIIFYIKSNFSNCFTWLSTLMIFLIIIYTGNFIIKIIRK